MSTRLIARRVGAVMAIAGMTLGLLGGCSSVPQHPKDESAAEANDYLRSGLAAAQNGRQELALSEYVKGLGADPQNAELHFQAAESQVAIGRYAEAAIAYRRALSLQPDHAGALEGLGLLLLRQGQQQQASEMLQKSVARNPKAWRSLNGLAALSDLRRDYKTALGYYSRALAINPSSPALLNNRGYSRYLAGSYDEARADFERALALDPHYDQGWRNLGLVMARTGKLDEAVNAFSQTMSVAEAAYSTGYVCLLDDRLSDAQRMFQRAIDLSPSYYAEAQEASERVRNLLAEQRSRPGRR